MPRPSIAILWLLSSTFACSSEVGTTGTGGGGHGGAGGDEGPPVVTELTPDAPPLPGQTECRVTITENLPNYGQKHEAICTPLTYATNPPSSGNHWPIWAAFRTYDTPIPREMYVHDLEHGAIVMTYRCDGSSGAGGGGATTAGAGGGGGASTAGAGGGGASTGGGGADSGVDGCDDIQAAFANASAGFGVDPLCLTTDGGEVSARFVVTPDPLLDRPIGLSAWRATYTATCIDPPSILGFIQAHYGNGPEQLCLQGKDPLDPATGVTMCPP